MTQEEVVGEFIHFLNKRKRYKNTYYKELMNHDPLYRTKDGNVSILNECGQDVEKYLLRMARGEKIINLYFPLTYCTFELATNNTIAIKKEFTRYFNDKHREEISEQKHIAKKLFVRYLKTYKAYALGKRREKRLELMDCVEWASSSNDYVFGTFPTHITSSTCSVFSFQAYQGIVDEFTDYYTKMTRGQ